MGSTYAHKQSSDCSSSSCLRLLVLLLHLVGCLLIHVAFSPRHGETLPDGHIGLGLCQQRITHVLLAALCPSVEALIAQWPNGHVALAAHEFSGDGCGLGGDAVDVHLKLLTEGLERQIIDVVTEGVLDLAADSRETKDDIGSEDGTGDGDPVKRGIQLERQNHDVDPCDLGDGDGVGNGQRSVENTVKTNEALIEGNNTSDYRPLVLQTPQSQTKKQLTGLVLVETNLESLIVDDAVDVRREMVKNFEREVTEGLLGALDPLAGVGLGECDTQELASRLQLAVLASLGNVNLGSFREGVQVLDALLEVGVVNARLESKPVLDGACVCVQKVQGGSMNSC